MRQPASRTRARATTRSTCSRTPGASRATRGTSTANIAELKSNIYRGVSGGYWFGHDEANYCLSYPAEIADPSLGNPHLFFQILPDDTGALAHTIIDPAPYIQAEYVKQPWLSF